MTPVEVFAVVASMFILVAASRMRDNDDGDFEWAAGSIVLALAWFVAVAFAMVI